MTHEKRNDIKPFISLILIFATLLTTVFFQMESRRRGYLILKLNRELKQLVADKRSLEVQLTKVTRPQMLDQMAQNKLTLKKINANQIIHLGGSEAGPLSSSEETP